MKKSYKFYCTGVSVWGLYYTRISQLTLSLLLIGLLARGFVNIKNKRKFFDKTNWGILLIIIFILLAEFFYAQLNPPTAQTLFRC